MSRSLRIAVAEDEQNMREYLRELLPRLGHQAIAVESGRQLVELCQTAAPDLVITDIRMEGLDGLEAAAQINRGHAVPVILVSAHHDVELRARAMQEHVMAYLIKPVKQEDLESAIDLAMLRFENLQAVRREAADLRQALEDRKLIERAKGVVMRRVGLDEAEAFRRLRKVASDGNHKMIEVARSVLAAEEVFGALDEGPPRGEARLEHGHRAPPRAPRRIHSLAGAPAGEEAAPRGGAGQAGTS